eukprot:2278361-Rhodomonas_salina.1
MSGLGLTERVTMPVQAYCAFCDTVLNDPTRVNELKSVASCGVSRWLGLRSNASADTCVMLPGKRQWPCRMTWTWKLSRLTPASRYALSPTLLVPHSSPPLFSPIFPRALPQASPFSHSFRPPLFPRVLPRALPPCSSPVLFPRALPPARPAPHSFRLQSFVPHFSPVPRTPFFLPTLPASFVLGAAPR